MKKLYLTLIIVLIFTIKVNSQIKLCLTTGYNKFETSLYSLSKNLLYNQKENSSCFGLEFSFPLKSKADSRINLGIEFVNCNFILPFSDYNYFPPEYLVSDLKFTFPIIKLPSSISLYLLKKIKWNLKSKLGCSLILNNNSNLAKLSEIDNRKTVIRNNYFLISNYIAESYGDNNIIFSIDGGIEMEYFLKSNISLGLLPGIQIGNKKFVNLVSYNSYFNSKTQETNSDRILASTNSRIINYQFRLYYSF